VSAPLEAAASRLLAAGMSYELARDVIADEIADAGAGCIARVARTASTPAAWRMVSADIERWQHPACPKGYAAQLSVAARLMRGADREMGPALAVATLDGWTCEGTAVFTVESPRAVLVTATVVPCGAGLDAYVSQVPGCTEGRVVATLRERASGRMAHPSAHCEGATCEEAIAGAMGRLTAALAIRSTDNAATQEPV
jgi:hypothetical protein